MKNTAKLVIISFSLFLLSGCLDEKGELEKMSDTEYQTSSETSFAESTISETTFTKQPSAAEETTISFPAEKKTEEQQSLEQLITEAAKIENPALKGNETIQSSLFGDFDGDGINVLIAVYGDKSDALYEDYCGGDVWFASGEKAEVLWHGLSNMPTWAAP